MSAMPPPADFCNSVKILLHKTQACALFDGFVSSMHEFYAGVRQRCPLAPLLYNFVAEAWLRFLTYRVLSIL